MPEYVYERAGHCPICEATRRFVAENAWYRDSLFCDGCGSVPRERALALILGRAVHNWREKRIHESSPVPRGISLKMSQECPGYVATQYYPAEPLGAMVGTMRNENLEATTFADGAFDIVLSLDVLEHVNDPAACFADMHRTLSPGGVCIFTAPTEKSRVESERVARYMEDGTIEYYAEPEYHGNPVNDEGALVTFRYGYELGNDIGRWAPFDVTVYRFANHTYGIIGEYTEVYECRKRLSDGG
jgi:SAM-dependent methyltransferase